MYDLWRSDLKITTTRNSKTGFWFSVLWKLINIQWICTNTFQLRCLMFEKYKWKLCYNNFIISISSTFIIIVGCILFNIPLENVAFILNRQHFLWGKKGGKSKTFARQLWSLSREGTLLWHTWRSPWPRFLESHLKVCPIY